MQKLKNKFCFQSETLSRCAWIEWGQIITLKSASFQQDYPFCRYKDSVLKIHTADETFVLA